MRESTRMFCGGARHARKDSVMAPGVNRCAQSGLRAESGRWARNLTSWRTHTFSDIQGVASQEQVGRRIQPLGDHRDLGAAAIDPQQPPREAPEPAVARPLGHVGARNDRIEERIAELEHVDRAVRPDLGLVGTDSPATTVRVRLVAGSTPRMLPARGTSSTPIPPSSPSGDPENSVTNRSRVTGS